MSEGNWSPITRRARVAKLRITQPRRDARHVVLMDFWTSSCCSCPPSSPTF